MSCNHCITAHARSEHQRRGAAEMAQRKFWEQDAAGSSPVTSTIIKRYSVYLSAVFYCLHDLSSRLEPVFNRAASRSRTQRVRASSPVTSTSSLWTSYRSQRLFQSHFSLTLSQLLFQHDPLRWARAGFLSGMQLIYMPFFIACTIFRQDSNLLLIAPRAEPDLPHAAFECIMKENPFLLLGETP